MIRRGNRQARKVTLEQVGVIRERYAQGETQSTLSVEFRLSVGQIGRIVRGESWQESAFLTAKQGETPQERMMKLQVAVTASKAPPSLLDGGDAADETGGAGISALVSEAAKALGAK